MRGYRLPGRPPGAALARGRALLVGDAAGLVDPLWGDGMYSAFLSSRLAAQAAVELLAGRATGLESYAQAVVAEFGPMMEFAWNAKVALDRFPRLALGALVSRPGWRTVESILRGAITEPGVERGVPAVALRGLQAWGGRAGWPGVEYRLEAVRADGRGLSAGAAPA